MHAHTEVKQLFIPSQLCKDCVIIHYLANKLLKFCAGGLVCHTGLWFLLSTKEPHINFLTLLSC